MSQSPLGESLETGSSYIDSFHELAERIRRGASFSGRERNCAFLNLGGRSFADASAALGLDLQQDSRGIALCDWDHDGDLDFWLTNRTAPRLQFMRNENAAKGNRSVAFLLEGSQVKRCPRDAAGARLVLSAGGVDRVQTVHLGDGFLSQSSRWLHFGLAGIEKIDRVVVHWPGSEAESFEGVEGGGRYVLKQMTGKAEKMAGKGSKVLAIKDLQLLEPTETARIWLSEPAELPADLVIPNLPPRSALIVLWASWCAPCIEELRAFGTADHLPLVPLNIENLAGEEKLTAKRAEALLQSLGVEQPGDFATSEIVEALNQIVTDKIYRHRNVPVPASFLVDQQRRVRAIYKGSVDLATVVEDFGRLGDSGSEADPRDAAVPFAGRWASDHFKKNPLAVAAAFRAGGYSDDARKHLENSLPEVGAGDGPDAKLRRADVHAKLGDIDYSENDFESAVAHYRRALADNPKLLPAQIFLAISLAESGQSAEATEIVAKLKAAAPGNPNFINLQADVDRTLGREAEAVAGYRQVLAINRNYVPAIEALVSILATSTDPKIRDAEEAVKWAAHLGNAPRAMITPRFLIAQADAYAAKRNFTVALHEAQRALHLVLPFGDERSIRELQDRIARYKDRKPYHVEPD